MKVRTLEKEIYNFVQKFETVSYDTIIGRFDAEGPEAFRSLYISSAYVAYGMSEQLAEALDNLRRQASIFEIASGLEFFEILGGGRDINLPIVHFNHRLNKNPYPTYGYQGKTWLPVVVCSDIGLKGLIKEFYRNCKKQNMAKYNKMLNALETQLKGDIDQRLSLAAALSEFLDFINPQIWKEEVKKMSFLVNIEDLETNEVKQVLFKPELK